MFMAYFYFDFKDTARQDIPSFVGDVGLFYGFYPKGPETPHTKYALPAPSETDQRQ
jgi:hypothetical protein